jgi:hypothetical protein
LKPNEPNNTLGHIVSGKDKAGLETTISHVFHKNCLIDHWKAQEERGVNYTCPTCRGDIRNAAEQIPRSFARRLRLDLLAVQRRFSLGFLDLLDVLEGIRNVNLINKLAHSVLFLFSFATAFTSFEYALNDNLEELTDLQNLLNTTTLLFFYAKSLLYLLAWKNRHISTLSYGLKTIGLGVLWGASWFTTATVMSAKNILDSLATPR